MRPATSKSPSETQFRALRDVLIEAVVAGAEEVVAARSEGSVRSRYKDASELVTTADERSDAAILACFEAKLHHIDPIISFYLEESGVKGELTGKWAGADPLDGTNHFACGGNFYGIQAHFVEDGVPLVGVICQPEVFLPLTEAASCIGRLVWAVRGEGAFVQQTLWWEGRLMLREPRRISPPAGADARRLVGSVPVSSKMKPQESAQALRVLESGLVSTTTGLGGAAANILMTVFGGHHFYANFGAGEDLDLIPGQVIAQEAGLAVCGLDGQAPVWRVRKQPVVVAATAAIAERVLRTARDSDVVE